MSRPIDPPLVLGSSSPFRQQILEKLGLAFTTASPDIDESRLQDESPEDLVQRLAQLKAAKVAETFTDHLIIGSDQVSVIDGEILGKPLSHDNAVRQLQAASGKTVIFYTALCLLNSRTGLQLSEVVPFEVVFRSLDDDEIERYLRQEQPYRCAGSFKSEGLGIVLFEKLVGDDPNTLIGLPLIRLCDMLRQQGITLP